MNEIIIVKETETNPYYDPKKTFNGGGYHQPLYEFEYGTWQGAFRDTSCGDFGSRYYILLSDDRNVFEAGWGTMAGENHSSFPETFPIPGFYQDFAEKFGVRIPTELQVDIEWYRKNDLDREWYVKNNPAVKAQEEKRLQKEKELLEEYRNIK